MKEFWKWICGAIAMIFMEVSIHYLMYTTEHSCDFFNIYNETWYYSWWFYIVAWLLWVTWRNSLSILFCILMKILRRKKMKLKVWFTLSPLYITTALLNLKQVLIIKQKILVFWGFNYDSLHEAFHISLMAEVWKNMVGSFWKF